MKVAVRKGEGEVKSWGEVGKRKDMREAGSGTTGAPRQESHASCRASALFSREPG